MPRNTGSEKDFLVTESKHDDYSATLQSSNVRLCSLVDQNMRQEQLNQRRLSTFFGVIVPCCLSMFSAILFLRMGFIVGQAGLLESVLMVILAYAIIGLTVLSICAISTNGAIEGGGAYFMISRALGPEFGGSIGLMFFLANAASSALYIFGIAEALHSFFGENGELAEGLPDGYWWRYLYGSVILLLCFGISVIGADIYAKATFLIFLIVMVSIISVVVSFFAVKEFEIQNGTLPSQCGNDSIIYSGLNPDTLNDNIYPRFTVDHQTGQKQNFVAVFAVLFIGCTGIMAGANMSGELKNPSRSIPIGTISACAITFIIYQILIILISATTPRELLQCDYSFLSSINIWSGFVAIGVFASSLSAALSCFIGASRILFAMAKDDLFGIVLRPVTKTTRNGNPIASVLATWFLIQLTLFVGKINTIAPFVTIFFLLSYAATDLACLALEWASAPNFRIIVGHEVHAVLVATVYLYFNDSGRPTFRLFTWHTCLLGFLSCITMMFFINPIYASVSIIVLIVLLIVIHYRVPTSSWGYISQALIFHQVRKYMLMLDIRKEHVKFWRPQILLMVKNPRTSCQLIDFINSIKKSGLYVLGNVKLGSLSEMSSDILSVDYQYWLNLVDSLCVKAFVELTLSSSIREGTQHLLRISGLGGMKPNTIVLGFYDDSPYKDTFKDTGLLEDKRKRAGSKLSAIFAPESSASSSSQEENYDLGQFFPAPDEAVTSGCNRSLSVDEYVSIMRDALKLQKNVCLARYFDQLDKAAVLANKGAVYYIDVWPVNFLRPLMDNDAELTSSTASSSAINGGFFHSSSYFDTTCVFLMQMACILNMTPFWKKRTKLRIFLCVEPGNENCTAPEDVELEEFLKVVRINAEIKQVELGNIPAEEFMPGQENTSAGATAEDLHSSQPIGSLVRDRPAYLKRVNALIRSHQASTLVNFLYLPAPPRTQSADYIDMLTRISDDLGPTFFVHGLYHVISTTL